VSVSRHGRPSAAYLATLRNASKADYDTLVRAAMEAIIEGVVDVLVAFPYTFKFPEDFPKGIRESEEGPVNIQRIKARKLLTWLADNGHTDITVAALKQQRELFTKFENNFLETLD
jgi:plasmid stabilization system protein ParE